jgi:pyruvate dehydrogenase E2 component (dihydrolipoamide acetyltransferase)
MWGRPSDPSIYGFVDIDVTDTLAFIAQHRERSGQRLTITHVVAQAVAQAFGENPDLNAKVRFGGRLEERQSVDLVISVARGGGRDLSAARVDGAETLAFIARHRERTGQRLTITHVVAQAVAEAFKQHPDLNAKVRFGGRIEERQSVDLVIPVARDDGRDLSAARGDAADSLALTDLVSAVDAQVERSRQGQDEDYERSRGLLARLPFFCLKPLLWLTDMISNELHLHLPRLGMPRDPFGTAVITNVGMFGIDTAFAPFVPLGRCPLLLLVTAVTERPVVRDGAVLPRPVLRLCATFDHRVIDGAAAGRLARAITHRVQNPAPTPSEPRLCEAA